MPGLFRQPPGRGMMERVMDATYRHTQIGYVTIVSLGIGAAVIAGLIWATPGPRAILVPIMVVLAACLAIFPSLTVQLDGQAVRVRFGVGPIGRMIPLGRIVACRAVRNRWYYGWGVRLIPRGWMFNVSGLDAVELEFAGGRKFRIGTDEPAALAAAIDAARGASGPHAATAH
ncbi:MAG: hypothetical protein BIFFINMI_02728 [Phycisphaerae bacterium]|nr:hypothetical protein [Phycisphaerae bacterium]